MRCSRFKVERGGKANKKERESAIDSGEFEPGRDNNKRSLPPYYLMLVTIAPCGLILSRLRYGGRPSRRDTRNEQFFPFSRGKASALITRWVNESNGSPYEKLLRLTNNATRG